MSYWRVHWCRMDYTFSISDIQRLDQELRMRFGARSCRIFRQKLRSWSVEPRICVRERLRKFVSPVSWF